MYFRYVCETGGSYEYFDIWARLYWQERKTISGKGGGGYSVSEVSSRQVPPDQVDYNGIDVVIDVAGIAHRKATPKTAPLFYAVNRDLAIELCKEAKRNGVKQFIYLSSMNVYGDTPVKIVSREQENPDNDYGNSKLQADHAIQEMNDDRFHVVSIRPPVVYGKGCEGNFQTLIHLTRLTPIFPDYDNIRSMIYIDNLCEFIRLVISNNCQGVFHPQDKENLSTTEVVDVLSRQMNHHIHYTKLFNPIIRMLTKRIRVVGRAFSDDYYDQSMSDEFEHSYCILDAKTAISNSV